MASFAVFAASFVSLFALASSIACCRFLSASFAASRLVLAVSNSVSFVFTTSPFWVTSASALFLSSSSLETFCGFNSAEAWFTSFCACSFSCSAWFFSLVLSSTALSSAVFSVSFAFFWASAADFSDSLFTTSCLASSTFWFASPIFSEVASFVVSNSLFRLVTTSSFFVLSCWSIFTFSICLVNSDSTAAFSVFLLANCPFLSSIFCLTFNTWSSDTL